MTLTQHGVADETIFTLY